MFASWKKLAAPVLAAAAVGLMSQSSHASAIKFTTETVGTPMSTFTDSGITFSNPSCIDGNKFVVQSLNWMSTLPDMTPGNVLTDQTNPAGFPIAYDFAFKMSFAAPINLLNMDMDYAVNLTAGGSIELEGFDSAGNLIATTTHSFFTNGILEDHLSLSGPSISSVVIVPTAIAEGFSNISYQTASSVPEPTSLCLFALGPILLGRRRRNALSV
jgi:hypothetical protein